MTRDESPVAIRGYTWSPVAMRPRRLEDAGRPAGGGRNLLWGAKTISLFILGLGIKKYRERLGETPPVPWETPGMPL